MEEIVLFVHLRGTEAPVEITVAITATAADLLSRPQLNLPINGLEADAHSMCVFVEEESIPVQRDVPLVQGGVRHGSRIHLSRHPDVEVEIHFAHRSGHHRFPPGTRVRRVKDWAVQHFGLAGNDAIEHALQLHGTADFPSPATPLSALLRAHHQKVTFDLVPPKRIEG